MSRVGRNLPLNHFLTRSLDNRPLSTFTQRMIAAQPFCIYCGGTTPASTIEHMPSRIIFDGKQRPKGLEFSACEPCNSSTRRAETVIAMLSRVYSSEDSFFDRREVRKISLSAFRNNPGLAKEMHMDQVAGLQRLGPDALKLPSWHFVRLGGPICQGALDSFGKKLALSLHYEATRLIVPTGGAVLLKHYSNVDAFTGELPDDLMAMFGRGKRCRWGSRKLATSFDIPRRSIRPNPD